MHLKRLENVGIVTNKMELSEDGKAMNFYELVPFAFTLTPEFITEKISTLTIKQTNSPTEDNKNNGKEEE
jgi:hypothetical protein